MTLFANPVMCNSQKVLKKLYLLNYYIIILCIYITIHQVYANPIFINTAAIQNLIFKKIPHPFFSVHYLVDYYFENFLMYLFN